VRELGLTKQLHELNQGTYVEPSKQKLGEYLLCWLEGVRVGAKTMADYRMNVEKRIIPRLGDVPIQKLTPSILDIFYRWLEQEGGKSAQGLSPRSVLMTHQVLHKALGDGVRKGELLRNPADHASPPKLERRQWSTWSVLEVRRYLEHVSEDRLSAAWLLECTTGMRRGELLGLSWPDVNLELGRVSVRQDLVLVDGKPLLQPRAKNNSSRRLIALDPATTTALRAHKARQLRERLSAGPLWEDTGLVFTRENGSLINPDLFSDDWFNKHRKAADLPVIRFHDLRHTYATLSLSAGIPLKVVSQRLGHASIVITADLYQHVTPQLEEDAAAKVANLILGNSATSPK
jgi:integrase